MYCTKCGKLNPDNALFCGYCGNKFPQVASKPEYSSPTLTFTDEDGVTHSITKFELDENIISAFQLSAEFFNKEIEGRTDELGDIYNEMVPVFDKIRYYTVLWHDKDYMYALGSMAMLMAKYNCEYSYDPETGEPYADTAYDVLKRYKAAYEDELDEKGKNRLHVFLSLAGKYCAYIAYQQSYLDYAANVIMELPSTPANLGLLGSCWCLMANSAKDYQMVRNSMSVLAKMDSEITQAPTDKVDQDIYRIAYGWYGLMNAKNPDTYPEGGFERNIQKAIYAVQRGLSLISDQEIKDMLQPDLDEYMSML